MAEGILSDAVVRILEVVGSLAFQEIQLAYGVKDELLKLKETVEIINGVLLDAEERFNQNKKDRAVTVWLRRLKDAVYDADDLLDDFYTELKLKEVMSGSKIMKEVRIFFSKSNQIQYGLKMGHKIKAIRERLNDIKNDKQFLLFNYYNGKGANNYNGEREQTHSFECEENVVGRDDDKKAILQLLLGSNDRAENNVSVISIAGIGGVGKTTLVQSIYNLENVKKHFQLRMWVCVSENFSLKIIVEKILKSAAIGMEIEKFGMDQLQERLRQQIDGKKYLLVLDDVWNENLDKWIKLETLLRKGAKGSRILVTTRSERVANIMSRPSLIYVLRGLTEAKSWSLFTKIAFEQGKEPRDSRFVAIGKDIVAKCVGVPLAIRTIGRLLYCNNKEEDWLSIRDNELSEITQEEGDILPILKLSYDHLSSQLKQCFAYCALFPKDYELEKENLIRLWMAQGFLHTSKKNQWLEDVGNEYFMDLFSGSFLQDLNEKEYPWGRVVTCKMHDLMHDLAHSVVGGECQMITSVADNVDERSLHISFDRNLNSLEFSTAMLRAKRLRTFFSFCSYIGLNEFYFNKILSNFECLRTLNLSHLEIKEVPSSISMLKHLRYLDLSWNENIKELPNSISELINLQTLDLSGCENLERLPRDMRKMVSLQYLMIDGCYSLTSMPHQLGQLTGLRTISLFVVGKRDSKNDELRELNGLNKLRGRLAIKILGATENVNLVEANLEEKQYLESIRLEGDIDSETRVEGLKPHPNLKELSVCCLGSVMFSGCMSSFTNLCKIEIFDSSNFRYITPLDQLPSLLSLTLRDLESLEYISDSGRVGCNSTSTPITTFFPSLKRLTIENCDKLKGWWKLINDDEDDQVTTKKAELISFPCLSELNIWYCPMLMCMPLYPTLKRLYLCRLGTKALQQTLMMKMKINTTADAEAPSTSYSAPALSNLKVLSLRFMNELECLPELLQRVTSLVEMDISDSPRLVFQLPHCIRYLSSLEQLRIGGYYQLDVLDDDDNDIEKWQGLRNLRHLVFERIEKMEGLPKWIHHITSLRLEKLEVVSCPHLSERCGNNKAVDWPKIAHIPNILVDDQWIQMEGCYQLVGTSQHLNISRNTKKDSRANKLLRDTTINAYIRHMQFRRTYIDC